MATPFLKELRAQIYDEYRSVRAFVRVAQPKDDEASAQSYLARVLAGKKPPPLAKLAGWADALHLTGAARVEFLDKCALCHLPPEVQGRFFAIYERFQTHEARLTRLERRLQ